MSRRVPRWLVPAHPKRPELARLGLRLKGLGVHTVCQSAMCPNVGECFRRGSATFMILGTTCTRNCGFCAIDHGVPASVDSEEPSRVARAAAMLGLHHVVVTSVTRDDLPDGGAGQFAATVEAVRELLPEAGVEVLVPDFGGSAEALRLVMAARPDVLNHNVETISRLYPQVRPEAGYSRSLRLLQEAGRLAPTALVKSGFMVGLGEDDDEIGVLLRDLRDSGVDSVTMGQYLQPTQWHLPVDRYVEPKAFDRYAATARGMGFAHVLSAPLVRSSYHAAEAAGLAAGAGAAHAVSGGLLETGGQK